VLKRIIIVEDFHVSVCYVTDLHEKDYKNVRPVSGLMFLGVAAYQIENGDTDKNAATLYALHSVLKGYANILSQDPQAKDKKLDELAKLNAEGKLPKLIQKKCK
jgi:hypothetical protein